MMVPGFTATARRRRLLQALAAVYAFRLGAAWLIALPVRNAVHASGILSFPAGERLLFEPGGLYLLEVLASQRALLAASLGPTLALGLLSAIASLGPDYLLLCALRPPERARATSAAAALPQLALIALGLLPLRALSLGLAFALALGARASLSSIPDARIADAGFVGVLALGAVVQIAASAFADLASAAVVDHGRRVGDATLLGLGLMRRRGSRLMLRYAGALLGSAAGYIAAALLVDALDVSLPQAWRGTLAVLTHQAACLASVAWDAWWLAGALRAVAAVAPQASLEPESPGSPEPPAQADAFL